MLIDDYLDCVDYTKKLLKKTSNETTVKNYYASRLATGKFFEHVMRMSSTIESLAYGKRNNPCSRSGVVLYHNSLIFRVISLTIGLLGHISIVISR